VKPRLQESQGIEVPAWPGAGIPRSEWVESWSKVAVNSFGGPAGQIAVMHEEIVVRRGWVSERRFLHALNYCMLLPGPEAQQLATYLGWMLRGPGGGLFAGAVFILPGFVSIMVLSIMFAAYGDVDWVAGMFFGITAAVVAIVASAVLRIGRRVITNRVMFGVAATAFVAVFVFEVPFPLIVAVALVTGFVGGRVLPDTFAAERPHAAGDRTDNANDDDRGRATLVDDDHESLGAPTLGRSIRVLLSGIALWFGPIVVLVVALGRGSIFVDVAWFFSTAAVLTFGGAYSVLAYIADAAVNEYGWLQHGDMLSGLGMAETTPGPLIQVVQFVGFIGPYRSPGSLPPLAAGVFGAVVATWVTFVPSFLWIFLGAPYVEQLRGRRSLTGALNTVTAAVVGVVLNLAVWFTVYTLFGTVTPRRAYGAVVHQPTLSSVEWMSFAITLGALVAVFRFKVPTLRLVLGAALIGILHGIVTS
jgi:chromate transporter